MFDKAFSGDFITVQHIHALAVMSWVFGKPPLFAYGSGARKVRVDIGDCRETFSSSSVSRRRGGFVQRASLRARDGRGYPLSRLRRKGVLETAYGGNVMIRGARGVLRGGETKQITRGGRCHVARSMPRLWQAMSPCHRRPSVQSISSRFWDAPPPTPPGRDLGRGVKDTSGWTTSGRAEA